MQFHVSAPGKMMLSGEWSVLKQGNSCIVAAVNRRVHALVESWPEAGAESFINPKLLIEVDDFKIKDKVAEFDGSVLNIKDFPEADLDKIKFIKKAIEVTFLYLIQKKIPIKNFKLRTWGEDTNIEIDGKLQKVGFGSSAAATVAVIGTILEYHGINAAKSKESIFKLSAIAHYLTQGKLGSCFDIAASTYGGVFHYIAPDLKWVSERATPDKIYSLIDSKWPMFHADPLAITDDFQLVVGWTKTSASTTNMIKQLNEWKEKCMPIYDGIIEEIDEIVGSLISAWKTKDRDKIMVLLKKNEEKLRELTRASSVPIETEDLKKLSDIANSMGAAGKLSGAGGGDCGIAVCFDEDIADNIKDAWEEVGIYPLDVTVDKEGVKIERKG